MDLVRAPARRRRDRPHLLLRGRAAPDVDRADRECFPDPDRDDR